jgi:two-component system, OmpR family, manganese sensing sensor histidine kinase
MFRSLRWRLTLWFVALSTVVYAAAVILGYFLFRGSLMSLLDEEVDSLIEEIRPAIVLIDSQPNLAQWSKAAKNIPFKWLPTIQLFDTHKHLIEAHGPPGIETLYDQSVHEIDRQDPEPDVRLFSTEIKDGNKLAGYLQIQLSMRSVDHATMQYVNTMGIITPFLILLSGVAGYFFSGKAARPLEESFELLRRFMTDAGHELSTPISIIQANAEAMEPDLPEGEPAFNKLTIINRSTERMGRLVSDLTLLSKMESPQVHARKSTIQLDAVLKAVLEEFAELFKNRGIELTYAQLPAVTMHGDSDALKRLMTNLLQNALRYTDEGGKVTVGLEPMGRYVKVEVKDTGVGIPAESLPKIFDRFYRVDKSRSRAKGGVGLGLSIVRAIVDAHKGRIEVISDVGKGTIFTITLAR